MAHHSSYILEKLNEAATIRFQQSFTDPRRASDPAGSFNLVEREVRRLKRLDAAIAEYWARGGT